MRFDASPRLSVGIYDHALDTIGGGQRYACEIAALLQDDFAVTLIANKPVSLSQLEDWYGVRLSRCRLKIIPLPYYEKKRFGLIDQSDLPWTGRNPFDAVSRESGNHDIFVNANMLAKVRPRSPVSIFVCHFPDSERSRFFHVDRYTRLITSSEYAIGWIQKKWNIAGAQCIYPAVEMAALPAQHRLFKRRLAPQTDGAAPPVRKEPIILSVARFEHTGSKNQILMAEIFEKICRDYPRETNGWNLILAGGSFQGNPYLNKVLKRTKSNPRIHTRTNLSLTELQKLYAKARIFWHACGLHTEDPRRIEHFGMSTVEAMQNRSVPVVINKGGQREIVEDSVSGFLFNNTDEWIALTMKLITQGGIEKTLAEGAFHRAQEFGRGKFQAEIHSLFGQLTADQDTYAHSQIMGPYAS